MSGRPPNIFPALQLTDACNKNCTACLRSPDANKHRLRARELVNRSVGGWAVHLVIDTTGLDVIYACRGSRKTGAPEMAPLENDIG